MDRELLTAVPDNDPRQWFRLVLALAAPQINDASEWVDVVQLKVRAMDDGELSSVREAVDGKLQFSALSDEALDVYFDLVALFAGS